MLLQLSVVLCLQGSFVFYTDLYRDILTCSSNTSWNVYFTSMITENIQVSAFHKVKQDIDSFRDISNTLT